MYTTTGKCKYQMRRLSITSHLKINVSSQKPAIQTLQLKEQVGHSEVKGCSGLRGASQDLEVDVVGVCQNQLSLLLRKGSAMRPTDLKNLPS